MSSDRLWKHRVQHILDAIQKIEAYTDGLDEAEFSAHSMAVDAVIRNFQIIGEAARKIPDDVQKSHPEIPWPEMQRMRHVLVHDYDRVDVSIVWNTIHKHLPPLVEPLKMLLVEDEDS